MTLTGNNAITLRKLTSNVTAEKGILPLKRKISPEIYSFNLENPLFLLKVLETYVFNQTTEC